MSGESSSYYSIAFLAVFLTAVWLASKLSRAVGVSSIVLEISVGLVLSPQILGFLPTEYAVCYYDKAVDCSGHPDQEWIADQGTKFCDLQAYLEAGKYADPWTAGFFGNASGTVTLAGHEYHLNETHRRLSSEGAAGKADYASYDECLVQKCRMELAMKCGSTPDILTLIGHVGVAMMIFESGMHFDFEQAKKVGLPACAVALCGTILPVVAGCGLVMLFGFSLTDGFAAGTALAPTSVGIALRLLHEAECLQTYFGQAIITAAFVDDILSLMLYNILFSLQDEITLMTFLPMIIGVIFMGLASAAGAMIWPRLIQWILSKIPDDKTGSKHPRHHQVLFFLMIVVLLAYAQITHMCGTHLWGCFIAGMSFAMWKEAHHIWLRQTKRLTCWMIRIFFSATVAFSIPISELLSWDAVLKGAIMGIVPCILTKVCCAPWMGDARWVIGWAMVGRAEFAYLIAQMAAAANMMEPAVFSIVIWALLWATVFAPFIFRFVLQRYLDKKAQEDDANSVSGSSTTGGVAPKRHGSAESLRLKSSLSLATGHWPDLYEEEQAQRALEEEERVRQLEAENTKLREQVQRLESSGQESRVYLQSRTEEDVVVDI